MDRSLRREICAGARSDELSFREGLCDLDEALDLVKVRNGLCSIEELLDQAKENNIVLPEEVKRALAERNRILRGQRQADHYAKLQPSTRKTRGGNKGNRCKDLMEQSLLERVSPGPMEERADYEPDELGEIESFLKLRLGREIRKVLEARF